MKRIYILTILLLAFICVGCNKDNNQTVEKKNYIEVKLTLTASEDALNAVNFSGDVTTGHSHDVIISAAEYETINQGSPKTFTFKIDEDDSIFVTFMIRATQKADFQPTTEDIQLLFGIKIEATGYDYQGKMLYSSNEFIQRNLEGEGSEDLLNSFMNFFPNNRVLFVDKTEEGYGISFAKAN